jgi:CpeS-like protein
VVNKDTTASKTNEFELRNLAVYTGNCGSFRERGTKRAKACQAVNNGQKDKMLSIEDFFEICIGRWQTERIYHYPLQGAVERSYTEFNAESLTSVEKHRISSAFIPPEFFRSAAGIDDAFGFAIGFATKSETGEEVSMQLGALFIPDTYLTYIERLPQDPAAPSIPGTAMLPDTAEAVQGFYLRDEGYTESGAITGRFTYLPSRQSLEMTTYYSQSVAVDQIRSVSPDLRLRTIVTYQRPAAGEVPTVINLVGFGLERRGA